MNEHERFPQAYQKTEASMGRRWPCRLEIEIEAKRDDEDRRKGGCRAGEISLRRKCLSGRHHVQRLPGPEHLNRRGPMSCACETGETQAASVDLPKR
jgi:hypothetical protein